MAFEIDELDHRHRTGWSVVVHGHAEHVTDTAAVEAYEGLGLAPGSAAVDPTGSASTRSTCAGRRIRWS